MAKFDNYGFWTVDGSTDFGVMPAGLVPGVEGPIPIKLQAGSYGWGEIHIERDHGRWLKVNKQSAASMVHLKLSQSGNVFTAEEDDKTKISLLLNPAALLILRYIPKFKFLTVVSVYAPRETPDGSFLGRYEGNGFPRAIVASVPIFTPPPPLPAPINPTITYKTKKSRRLA